MNAKLTQLAERRATLAARAATQRVELSQALAHWRGPLAVVDQGLAAVRYIRNHAPLLVGLVAFVVPLRPLRAVKWVRRGWMVWRMAVTVKRILTKSVRGAQEDLSKEPGQGLVKHIDTHS